MAVLEAMVLLHVWHLGLVLAEDALGWLLRDAVAGGDGEVCCRTTLVGCGWGGLVAVVGGGMQREHLH